MKKRAFLFFVLVVVFYVVSATSIEAQATFDDCSAIYQVVFDNRNSPDIKKLRLARLSASDYLTKCGDIKDQEQLKTYVTGQIPKIEERIKQAEIKLVEERYNNAIKNKNYDDMLSFAKELLKMDRPYSLDLMLDIASVGYDNASARPAVNKYNDDAVTFAKKAIQAMSEGKTSGNVDKVSGKADLYGGYIAYKTAKCVDGKTNAAGWMNFTIGYITYVGMKKTIDALPYLYKASQAGCETKENSEVYRLIGSWYIEELAKLDATRMEKVKAAGDNDTDETLSILAMQKGYVERAMDAYARAYKTAKASETASQATKDSLLKKLKGVYEFRYDGDLSKFDPYLEKAGTTPFVDPATPVTPVKEEPPPPAPVADPKSKATPKSKTTPKSKAVKAPSQKQPQKSH